MELVVDTTLPARVVIGAKGLVGLAQEVRTLLATRKGSVPLDRDFGISWDLVDTPLPVARQLFIAEVATQLHRYVPRVRFKGIDFPNSGATADMDGIMAAAVTVEIREEFLDDFR